MASFSNYIDAMLTTPMKEGESKKISFPDIAPDTWETMMQHMEPGEKLPSLETALDLVEFYHKYDFPYGLRLCDRIFATDIGNFSPENYSSMNNFFPKESITLFFTIFLSSRKHGLDESMKVGANFLVRWLSDTRQRPAQCKIPVPLLGEVKGVFVENNDLWACFMSVMDDEMPEGARQDVVGNPCFAAMLVNRIRYLVAVGLNEPYWKKLMR